MMENEHFYAKLWGIKINEWKKIMLPGIFNGIFPVFKIYKVSIPEYGKSNVVNW